MDYKQLLKEGEEWEAAMIAATIQAERTFFNKSSTDYEPPNKIRKLSSSFSDLKMKDASSSKPVQRKNNTKYKKKH